MLQPPLSFLDFPCEAVAVLTGDEIRRARERAGMTQEELGAVIGVSLRTIGNWERGQTVPRNRAAALRAALAAHLDDAHGRGNPLATVSDVELLAEIARRFARGKAPGELVRDDRARSLPSEPHSESSQLHEPGRRDLDRP